MGAIGKVILILGLFTMVATFVLAMVLYIKNQRMELAVMSFALAAALAICGVTATLLERFNERRAKAAELEFKKAELAAEAKAVATNQTWFSQPDGTYIHADGSTGARTAAPAVPGSAENAVPTPAEQPAEPAEEPSAEPAQPPQDAGEAPPVPQ